MEDMYKTKDMYIAAFLKLKGCTILGSEDDGYGRMYFLFSDRLKCIELEEEYLADRGSVPPLLYKHHLRLVKDMIFNSKNSR